LAPATKKKSDSAIWLTSFAAAQQQAKAAGKYILMDFTGSDWCPWCMRLDSEILATPEFREFADKHLVLVKVDFPRHHSQSAAEQTQNEQLAAQFQVQGYPTLVVLNPDSHELGTLGYMSGGPKTFIDELVKLIAGS
jgi:thioredoxin-related protein